LIYKDGEPWDGKRIKWYSIGKKETEEIYKDGEKVFQTTWYDNGEKGNEGAFKDGKRDGLWTSWYDNGEKIFLVGNFKYGKQDGLWTYWYENGKKKGEETYKDGELIEWTEWDEDGNVTHHKKY